MSVSIFVILNKGLSSNSRFIIFPSTLLLRKKFSLKISSSKFPSTFLLALNCSFLLSNAYPSGGVISSKVYIPVIFFPSTYSYKFGIVSAPFSFVVYVLPFSPIPSPVILYCAPFNVKLPSFAYFLRFTWYVGIFSFVSSAVTVSCASKPDTPVPVTTCEFALNLPLITTNSKFPELFATLNVIGSSFT